MEPKNSKHLSDPAKHELKVITSDALKKSFEVLRLRKRQRVMDFGCGNGYDLSYLSKLVDIDGEVWGVDQDPIMIKNAILNNSKSNVRFLKSSSQKLNFPNDYFHAVRASNVFPFLDYPAQTLKELIRVTQKGGVIVSLDMDWQTLSINSNHPAIEEEIKVAASKHMSKNMLTKGKIYDLFQKSELEDAKIEVLTICINNIEDFNETFFKNFTKINQKKELIAKHDMNIFTKGLYEKSKNGDFFVTICQALISAKKPALQTHLNKSTQPKRIKS
jgi:ubiquinone/menaquinone biosynthesis C-methylase UbiE